MKVLLLAGNDRICLSEKMDIYLKLMIEIGMSLLRHPIHDTIVCNSNYYIISGLPNTDDSFWIKLYPGMGDRVTGYAIKTICEGIHA